MQGLLWSDYSLSIVFLFAVSAVSAKIHGSPASLAPLIIRGLPAVLGNFLPLSTAAHRLTHTAAITTYSRT